MKFRIFRQAKNAMQSGKKNMQKWLILPIEEKQVRSINPLTGWISAQNINSQFRFEFLSKEEAIKFAQESMFNYVVEEPKEAVMKPKSYAANFTN
jgi:hypothetical protein